MSLTHPPLSWLILGLPLVFVLVGLVVSFRRWRGMKRHPAQDPESLLLGAVSQSLQERGRLAASLGELRTVHERLLDALPFGILWVDLKGQVAAINAEGRAILGVKAGVVGLDAAFVLEPFPWILEGLAQPPGPAWRADGGGRRWQLRRIQVPDIVGSLLQFEDITEREAGERRQQLRERFAELGEMTAGVAHQLKNGLAVLKGHGQLLDRAGHHDTAQDLLEEVQSLERLAQRFLLWAKPLEPRIAPVRLEEIASQAAMEVHRRPAFQDRTLTVEGEGRADADPMLLHQALVNLVENACQATPPGRRVRVQVVPGQIAILDEGPGFDPGDLARMLRPFESGRPEGTGLGLPLALKWLNATGADLVFSLRPEGGTRVDVRL
ncbi:sensor histidine kinase [Mesoterricola sediminis]|uniref:sensor histidine kinase n=1 Tax=Mesoterricola sediminis TaxID=2927980 RepID=UPI001FB02D40|nr:ATP-binding protein [Mesoterricola sediminis]